MIGTRRLGDIKKTLREKLKKTQGEEAALRFFTKELFERRQSEDDAVLEASMAQSA